MVPLKYVKPGGRLWEYISESKFSDSQILRFSALSRSILGVRRSYFTGMEVPGVLSKKVRIFIGGLILGGSYPRNGLKNASIGQYPGLDHLGFGGFSYRSRPVFGVNISYLARRGGIGLLFGKTKNFHEISILGGIFSPKTSKFCGKSKIFKFPT